MTGDEKDKNTKQEETPKKAQTSEKAPSSPAGPVGPRLSRAQRPGFDVPSSTVHPHAEELETLVMARRYAEEGLAERAVEILEKLLALDPADEALQAELTALRATLPPPRLPETPARASAPPPKGPEEPLFMLDLEDLPETYGVDECEVLYKDPNWVFAYWEVTDQGLEAARAQLGPSAGSARLVLRLFTTAQHGAEVERSVNDVDLPWNHGRRYLPTVKPGAHLRVAVGLLSKEGYFAPIAHSSLQRIPHAEPAPPGLVDWMEVLPGRTRGREREPIVLVKRGVGHSERALAPSDKTPSPGEGPTSPGGSSRPK